MLTKRSLTSKRRLSSCLNIHKRQYSQTTFLKPASNGTKRTLLTNATQLNCHRHHHCHVHCCRLFHHYSWQKLSTLWDVFSEQRQNLVQVICAWEQVHVFCQGLSLLHLHPNIFRTYGVAGTSSESISENIVIRNRKIVSKHGPNRPFFLFNLSSEIY